jgi:hypothetical protein
MDSGEIGWEDLQGSFLLFDTGSMKFFKLMKGTSLIAE